MIEVTKNREAFADNFDFWYSKCPTCDGAFIRCEDKSFCFGCQGEPEKNEEITQKIARVREILKKKDNEPPVETVVV